MDLDPLPICPAASHLSIVTESLERGETPPQATAAP
jgi:hypothetical protein